VHVIKNISMTEMAKPPNYDAYWENWLQVCVEGIIKEYTERQQRSDQPYDPHDPLDQEYHVSGVNN